MLYCALEGLLLHSSCASLDAAAGLACKDRTLRQSSQNRIEFSAALLKMPSSAQYNTRIHCSFVISTEETIATAAAFL